MPVRSDRSGTRSWPCKCGRRGRRTLYWSDVEKMLRGPVRHNRGSGTGKRARTAQETIAGFGRVLSRGSGRSRLPRRMGQVGGMNQRKLVGASLVAVSVERSVLRYDPELSFFRQPTADAADSGRL